MSAEFGQFGLAAAAFATLNTESLSSSPSTSGGQFKLPATALATGDQRLRTALTNTSTGHAACAATTLCSVSFVARRETFEHIDGAFGDQRGGDRRRVVVAGSQTPRQTRAAVGVGRSRHSVVDTCGGVADSDEPTAAGNDGLAIAAERTRESRSVTSSSITPGWEQAPAIEISNLSIGVIPACAGNRAAPLNACGQWAGSSLRVRETDERRGRQRKIASATGHPCVCGEQRGVDELDFLMAGSSLPGAGNRCRWFAHGPPVPGHPCVCGEQHMNSASFTSNVRVIPACAGNRPV